MSSQLMLQCKTCLQRLPVDKSLLAPQVVLPGPGDDAYEYSCSGCGSCSLKHKQKTSLQLATTALYNLQRTHRKKYFDFKDEICEFVRKNWNSLSGASSQSPASPTSLNLQSLEQEFRGNPSLFENRATAKNCWALTASSSALSSRKDTVSNENAQLSKKDEKEDSEKEEEPKIDETPNDNQEDKTDDKNNSSKNKRKREKSSSDDEADDYDEDDSKNKNKNNSKKNKKSKNKKNKKKSKKSASDDEDEPKQATLSNSTDGSNNTKNNTSNIVNNDNNDGLKGPMWCHQCKQKHNEVFYCTLTCSKKYCARCVARHYNEKVDEIDITTWTCYYCRGACICAFCRRKRAKATNTEFESKRKKKKQQKGDNKDDKKDDRKDKVEEKELDSDDGDNEEDKNRRKKRRRNEEEYAVDTEYVEESRRKRRKRDVDHEIHEEEDDEDDILDDLIDEEDEEQVTAMTSSSRSLRRSGSPSRAPLPQHQAPSVPVERNSSPALPTRDLSTRDRRKPRDSLRDSAGVDEKSHSTISSSSDSSHHHDVTLMDLLRIGLLHAGDELFFRQSDRSGILQEDGKIKLSDGSLCNSLSSFAKKVVNETSMYNGWRVIFCRGKPMDAYRKEYSSTKGATKLGALRNSSNANTEIHSSNNNNIISEVTTKFDENSVKYSLPDEIPIANATNSGIPTPNESAAVLTEEPTPPSVTTTTTTASRLRSSTTTVDYTTTIITTTNDMVIDTDSNSKDNKKDIIKYEETVSVVEQCDNERTEDPQETIQVVSDINRCPSSESLRNSNSNNYTNSYLYNNSNNANTNNKNNNNNYNNKNNNGNYVSDYENNSEEDDEEDVDDCFADAVYASPLSYSQDLLILPSYYPHSYLPSSPPRNSSANSSASSSLHFEMVLQQQVQQEDEVALDDVLSIDHQARDVFLDISDKDFFQFGWHSEIYNTNANNNEKSKYLSFVEEVMEVEDEFAEKKKGKAIDENSKGGIKVQQPQPTQQIPHRPQTRLQQKSQASSNYQNNNYSSTQPVQLQLTSSVTITNIPAPSITNINTNITTTNLANIKREGMITGYSPMLSSSALPTPVQVTTVPQPVTTSAYASWSDSDMIL